MAKQRTLSIFQGKTFIHIVRWEAADFTYKPIQSISRAAPVVITSATHGLPTGWRTAILSVVGMEEINAVNTPPRNSDFHKVIAVDPNTVSIADINSADFSAYVSGGYLAYKAPVDLAGLTARMSIKNRVGGALITPQLTSGNSQILIDNTAKTITLVIDAATTAAITASYGVYDLELVSGSIVTPLLYGNVNVQKEVTS